MEDHFVGREALYDLVWSESISKLAERYGYSDVGFAKLCRRAGVPLPTRGHWARAKAGQKVLRTPLAPIQTGQLERVRLVQMTDAEQEAARVKRDQRARARVLIPPERVAEEANHLHPLARAAQKRLKHAADSCDYKGIRSAPKEILDLQVTKDAIDRAARIASLVVRELEHLGAIFRIDPDKGRTDLELHGTRIGLRLTEHVARTPHEATPAESRALDRWRASRFSGEYPRIPEHDFTPTGFLTITACGWPERNWRDTNRTPLENRLGEVVAGIVSLAEEVRNRESENARKRAEHRRKQEHYEAEMERRASERVAYEALLEDGQKWAAANQLRAYLLAVYAAALKAGRKTAALDEWLEWAARKADWLDPTILVSDAILDAPEPEKPSYGYW